MKPSAKYQVIYKNKDKYAIASMCQFFKVSRSGYYDYVKRKDNRDKDESIAKLIQERRTMRFGKSLGCRRMQKWLANNKKITLNYKTVWRIMHKYGLLGECRRKRYHRPSEVLNVYPNLLARNFTSAQADKKWVTDITYIQTPQGTLYLSAIMDLHGRRVVAYKTSRRNDCKLVSDTLKLALKTKEVTVELHLHSDQGFQYTSHEYATLTQRYGITPSMSRRANPYDNAVIENFFGMFKTECIYLDNPKTIRQAQLLVRKYIDFYNTERMALK